MRPAALLAYSDEQDIWRTYALAMWREGYRIGFAGVDEGRRVDSAERDASWHAIAAPIARGGLLHAELERRHWGPGGREHFGDPRPGDYPGREAAA